MLICRLYLGLMRTITDDYGAEFAVHSERVGNAYRVTDKVNIPDLQKKLQRRIDLVTENAQRIIRIVGTLADSTDATTSGIKGREDRRPSAGLGRHQSQGDADRIARR